MYPMLMYTGRLEIVNEYEHTVLSICLGLLGHTVFSCFSSDKDESFLSYNVCAHMS